MVFQSRPPELRTLCSQQRQWSKLGSSQDSCAFTNRVAFPAGHISGADTDT